MRLKEVHITEILLVIGLGLTAEATSLRRPDLHEDSVYKMPPRLNCRGNFVEACRHDATRPSDSSSLGLTAEATSLRPERSGAPRTHCGLPRLNCRGNFVEAQRHAHPDVQERHGLGLTAEATSLRLFVGGLLGDALDSRLGLTAEATSLRLSRPSPRCAQPQGASA